MNRLVKIAAKDIVIPLHQDPQRSTRGDMQALAADIETNGMLHAILVTTEHVLLDGARRLALLDPLDTVMVREVDTNEEVYDFLEQAAHPLQVPYDFRRAFDLHIATLGIREKQRNQRIREHHRKRGGLPQGVEPKQNWTRRRQAEVTGLSLSGLQSGIYLYSRLFGFRPYPAEDMDLVRETVKHLEANGSPGVRLDRFRRVDKDRKLSRTESAIRTAGDQRTTLTGAVSTFRGAHHSLRSLAPIHQKLTPEECSLWARDLRLARETLNRTIRLLNERISQG